MEENLLSCIKMVYRNTKDKNYYSLSYWGNKEDLYFDEELDLAELGFIQKSNISTNKISKILKNPHEIIIFKGHYG